MSKIEFNQIEINESTTASINALVTLWWNWCHIRSEREFGVVALGYTDRSVYLRAYKQYCSRLELNVGCDSPQEFQAWKDNYIRQALGELCSKYFHSFNAEMFMDFHNTLVELNLAETILSGTWMKIPSEQRDAVENLCDSLADLWLLKGFQTTPTSCITDDTTYGYCDCDGNGFWLFQTRLPPMNQTTKDNT